MLTHLSTFSGIEGIGLAAEAEGFQAVGHCDIEPFAREVIRHHWPDTPIWWDIRHMNRRRLIKKLVKLGVLTRDPRFGSLVDLLSGGFPCQPFSLAGKREGEFDQRHLFPELARFIREVRPRWVLLENVPGLFSANSGRVFRDVLGALAAMGYRVGWCCYGAGEVGAPHRRERVFIIGCLADAEQERSGGQQDFAGRDHANRTAAGREESTSRAKQRCEDGTGNVADAKRAERRETGTGLSGLDGGLPGLHAGRQEGASRSEQRCAEGSGADDVADSNLLHVQGSRNSGTGRGHEPTNGGETVADATGARHACGQSGTGGTVRDEAWRSQPERRSSDVADADGDGESQSEGSVGDQWRRTGVGGEQLADSECSGRNGLHEREQPRYLASDVGDSSENGSRRDRPEGYCGAVQRTGTGSGCEGVADSDNRPGGAETAQSGLGGTADELPARMDLDSWPGWPAGPGQEQNPWEPPRVAQGVQDRVARLKGLGNAVSPHQVRPILRAIREAQQAIASR